MNAALYMRMSTDKQENSIESQERFLRRYAQGHQLNIVAKYVDEGISGRSAEKRPAFLRMIDDSSEGGFQSVLVYDSSRFARNLEESLVYKSMLRRNGVQVLSATEPSLDDDSALITDAMLGALNEMYSRKLSKAVKRGMFHQAEQGKHQCAPPFGYIKQSGQLQIHPAEAAVVQHIYSLFLDEGYPIRKIALLFNDYEIPKRKSCIWYARDIQRILKNAVYAGYINFDNRRFKGNHPPVIQAGRWEQAQERLMHKLSPACTQPAKIPHWLSGILRCAHCSGAMVYIRDTKGNSGFRCGNYGNGRCAHSNFISAAIMEDLAIHILGKQLDLPLLLRRYRTAHSSDQGEQKKQLLQAALHAQKQKLERFRQAYAAGIDSLEEYEKNKTACRQKLEQLAQEADAFATAGSKADVPSPPFHCLGDLLQMAEIDNFKKNAAAKEIMPQIFFNKSLSNFVVHCPQNTI